MVDIIRKMFDFDLEVSELDNNLFSVKEKIEVIFNFMDLFFQLYDGPKDPIVASLLKKMVKLRKYYDKKATLNMYHSETIVEIFRYCVRKDPILFEKASQEQTIGPIQTNPMELESQTKCEWLCSRNLLICQFEATLDSLTGDGQSIFNEFIDWESAGPTVRFNELRDDVVKLNTSLTKITCICSDLHILEGIPRKFGLREQLHWKV